jgi:hypothetical protein
MLNILTCPAPHPIHKRPEDISEIYDQLLDVVWSSVGRRILLRTIHFVECE